MTPLAKAAFVHTLGSHMVGCNATTRWKASNWLSRLPVPTSGATDVHCAQPQEDVTLTSGHEPYSGTYVTRRGRIFEPPKRGCSTEKLANTFRQHIRQYISPSHFAHTFRSGMYFTFLFVRFLARRIVCVYRPYLAFFFSKSTVG